MENTTPEYERISMASLVAEIISGIKGAEPDDSDFKLADELLIRIENSL